MERWIEHYSSAQEILLVGEGDFSFSACLARAFGYATNMVATSLDSQESLWAKHPSCVSDLYELRQRGCVVLHDVDVQDMDLHHGLRGKGFDVIIFNFPHAGFYPGFGEKHHRVIEMHRQLLRGFFASAQRMLYSGGEIHVTTRDDFPYNTWDVEELADEADLVLTEKVLFKKSDYPGYCNKRGGNIDSNKSFPLGESYTYKFEAESDESESYTYNFEAESDESESYTYNFETESDESESYTYNYEAESDDSDYGY